MKKYIYICIITLGIGLTSCQDWLDVPFKTRTKAEDLFQSEAGFREALRGIYIGMAQESLYGRELTFGFFEVIIGNFALLSNHNTYYQQVAEGRLMNTNVRPVIDRMWAGLYNLIANINFLLENIENQNGILTGNNYEIMKGEALALRAFLHLELFKIFGNASNLDTIALPYVVAIGTEVTPSSATGHDFLNLVMKDLDAALVYLEKDPIFTTKNKKNSNPFLNDRQMRMNYYAAQAVYARAALWAGNDAKALEKARYVIAASNAVFPWVLRENVTTSDERSRDFTFSTEHIFCLNVSNLRSIYEEWLGASAPATRLLSASGGPWGNFANWFQVNAGIGNSDYRYVYLREDRGLADNWGNAIDVVLLSKFSQPVGYNPEFANRIPLIRRSEMYYIVAEVLSKTDIPAATEYLNAVRIQRGITTPLAGLTQAQFDRELDREHIKEFWGEGHYFFFYKRRNIQTNPPDRWLPWVDGGTFQLRTAYVLPRPDAEIELGR